MKLFVSMFCGFITFPASVYMTYCMWSKLGLSDWKFVALEALIILPAIIGQLILVR